MIRLLADAHMSRRFVEACLRLQSDFPIVHIADWLGGKHRMSQDPVLLPVLREHGLIITGFDWSSTATLKNRGGILRKPLIYRHRPDLLIQNVVVKTWFE